MNILIVGPSRRRSKGGTATVIYEHLNNPRITEANQFTCIESHVDGLFLEKAWYLFRCICHIFFYHNRYDLVHIHANSDVSFYRKAFILRFTKWFRKKVILQIHGHDFDKFYSTNTASRRKYIENSLRKSDLIIVLSPYWKRFFDNEFRTVPTVILHNGVDVESYKSCIRPTSVFNKFLFMGRLGKRKGVYDLLRAIEIVVNEHARGDLIFYLAGDGEVDVIGRQVEEKGLSKNVIVTGWLSNDEKRELLKNVHVVVLPSYEENLPMALIEGMASGKVVISSFAGGIPDLIKPNFNGFLCEAGDIATLVNHVLYVADNPNEMLDICRNNVDTVKESFNVDTIAQKLNSIYATL